MDMAPSVKSAIVSSLQWACACRFCNGVKSAWMRRQSGHLPEPPCQLMPIHEFFAPVGMHLDVIAICLRTLNHMFTSAPNARSFICELIAVNLKHVHTSDTT